MRFVTRELTGVGVCLLIKKQNVVFENFNVQAGNDQTGVATDMLSINSTVKIHYKNPGTFFAVHVSSSPLELHFYQLKIGSGQVNISTLYIFLIN